MKFLILLALVPLATCYVVVPGKCPEVTPVENFEPEKLTNGEWYTISRFQNQFDDGYKCGKDSITYNEDGFHGLYENLHEKTNAKESYAYTMVHVDGKAPVFEVVFNMRGESFRLKNVYILDTDYDNYLLFYMCSEDGANSRRLGWLQAKNKRTLSEEYVKKAYKVFDQQGLGSEHFDNYNQQDC